LTYCESRATRDVDAIFEPKMRVYGVARSMADERGLPRDSTCRPSFNTMPSSPKKQANKG